MVKIKAADDDFKCTSHLTPRMQLNSVIRHSLHHIFQTPGHQFVMKALRYKCVVWKLKLNKSL